MQTYSLSDTASVPLVKGVYSQQTAAGAWPKGANPKRFWNGFAYATISLAILIAVTTEGSRWIEDNPDARLPSQLYADDGSAQSQKFTQSEIETLTREAHRYRTGDGVPENSERAFLLYQDAAEQGDPEAMNWLGLLYADGLGTSKDPAAARHWFEKAAAGGNSDGIANIGWLYRDGIGITQDYTQARKWFQKAVDLGNHEAMNLLGLLHADGLGAAKNPDEARKLFEKAAAMGNIDAINNVGWLYRDGIGVAQNFETARKWFQKAADQGNAVSAWSLSILLDEGKGGRADYQAAATYLLQAAKAGQADATKELAGTMENWNAATRGQLKAQLKDRGLYFGPLDSEWDGAAKTAIRSLSPATAA